MYVERPPKSDTTAIRTSRPVKSMINKCFGRMAFTALLFNGVAFADLLLLNSGAGLTTSMGGVTTVAVDPHPSWQSNNPVNPGDPTDTSAVWISFADTGYGGNHLQPFEGTTPVVTIYDQFQSDPGMLLLNVWADDSADVLLDGVYLYHAQFTQSICAGQAIGCRPGDLGVINTPLTAGNHTLAFVLYQVGTGTDTFSNPFGLLFTGTAPADPPIGILIATPEPSSIVLLGTLGLIGAILLKRGGRWGRTGVFVAGR